MYTLTFMSSRGGTVRQHAISGGHILLFSITIFVLCFAAIGGLGYGFFQKYQRNASEKRLQMNLEKMEELTQTKRRIELEFAAVNAEMNGIRDMVQQIQETLGILGQGGGESNIAWTSEGTDEPLDAQQEYATLINAATYVGKNQGTLTPNTLKQEIQPLYDYIISYQQQIDEYPSILPVKLQQADGKKHAFWYSSEFGRRIHPLTRQREFHHGLDIKTRAGVPVIAAADGTVITVGNRGYLGKAVEIAHAAPQFKTLYAHLKDYANDLKEGQSVTRGQIIGYVGNTGRSTGAHLHYGVYDTIKEKWVNPMPYILDQQPTFSP